MSDIFILGAGGWGTALAIMCAKQGHRVTLWSHSQKRVEELCADGENKRLLPGVAIPKEIVMTSDLSGVEKSDIVVFVVPSSAVREVAQKISGRVREGTVIVNGAKGIEKGTFKRMSEIISEELPQSRVAVLSGPSHAEEVARGMPTTVVAASKDKQAALAVQDVFMNPVFRIYVSPDIVGVELGGTLKNIIALAAGVCDGLKLGDNTKAALMTRGITEMARLGVALGGNAQTFAGLAGIGDLIVTCTSMHSRNRRAGILIGEGIPASKAVEKIGMTVEGYFNTLTAYQLSQKAGIEMPIVNECYHVLYQGKDPQDAIRDLMSREKKHELEATWINNISWD